MPEKIPFPNLQSWMHARVTVPQEDREERQIRYENLSDQDLVIDCVASTILGKTGLLSPGWKWITYRLACHIIYVAFRCLNRMEVCGRENIPRAGAIFYVNHQSAIDPAVIMAATRIPFGFFVDSGNGWLADTLETAFGFVSHQGSGEEIVEKFIRTIMQKNPFFAIWPEGYYEKEEVVRGFSGIVKAYAVLNSQKNIIPFVPVILQGAQCYRGGDSKRLTKIRVTFLNPVFLPRRWLHRPMEGGKTPRDIMDALMRHLARKLGQQTLGRNWYLESRRRYVE